MKTPTKRLNPLNLICSTSLFLGMAAVSYSHADVRPVTAAISTDVARGAWQFRRGVSLVGAPKEQPGYGTLVLPPEVGSSSQSDGRDLRLLVFSNQAQTPPHEVPYILKTHHDSKEVEKFSAVLVDTQSVPDQKTVWLLDLGNIRSFDTLFLQIPNTEFAKRFLVEAANQKEGPFRAISSDVGLFDRVWNTAENSHLHQTQIWMKEPETARFLRVTADDREGPPVSLQGAEVMRSDTQAGSEWSRQAVLIPLPTDPRDGIKISRYRIELPQPLPIQEITLTTSESTAFLRPVRFFELKSPGKKETPERKLIGKDIIYQGDANHPMALVASPGPLSARREFPEKTQRVNPLLVSQSRVRLFAPPQGKVFLLEIENQDSPPLRDVQVSLSGPAQSLIFPVEPGQREWVLYYGNPQTRAPVYDLAQLQEYITSVPTFSEFSIGEEQQNPLFHSAAPLEFVHSVGGILDTSRYRMVQPVILPSKEDIYMIILSPTDLAWLRSDVADLRLVNEQNQQIPYVIESDAYQRSVELKLTPLLVKENPHLSRYRVQFLDQGQALPIPLQALDIEVEEQFYVRPVRVLKAPQANATGEGTVIAIGQMHHRGDESSLQRIPLPQFENRYQELIVEIDNQDNAPLRIRSIHGLVSVPRMSFKLKPEGSYRLLLGNEQAESPRYDLQHLSTEVLSYSAQPAELGDLQPNPSYVAETKSIFSEMVSKIVIFAIVIIATVVLLMLAFRLIRKPTKMDIEEEI